MNRRYLVAWLVLALLMVPAFWIFLLVFGGMTMFELLRNTWSWETR